MDQPNTSSKQVRLLPTLGLLAVVLLATWMGNEQGGYFVGTWGPVALILAALALIASVGGALRSAGSRWSALALALLAAYAVWTFPSLLWSPNRGDAWLGAGQTLLYLLAFWLAVGLLSLGASRRWALAASVGGPAMVAALTWWQLIPRMDEFFGDAELTETGRLLGTVGYYNAEAAFFLVPFWVAAYVAGSRRMDPILRGAALAGTVLGADLAVLTQSRGAMYALIASLPVFFLLSGQRLRGLLALAPVAAAVAFAFPGLSGVYEAFGAGDPAAAIERVVPTVWLTAGGAGRYGSVSGSGRYTLWQVAWEDFENHPVLGVGTGNYGATYFRLRDEDAGDAITAHSLPLEVLAERGAVGGILFFGFLAVCLGAGVRQRFGRLGEEGKAQVGAVVAA